MFKLSQFKAEIETSGVMRTNQFMVNFAPPPSLRNDPSIKALDDSTTSSIAMDRISLRCEAVQMPGMSFATLDGPPRLGYGPIEAIPYGAIFDDITLTFLVDSRGDVHRFFYNWMNSIVNFQSKGQSAVGSALGPVKGMKAFEVNFKDNFVTDINIEVYDVSGSVPPPRPTPAGQTPAPAQTRIEFGRKIMASKVYRAFPKLLPSFDLAWNTTDEIVRISIPFTYTDFETSYF